VRLPMYERMATLHAETHITRAFQTALLFGALEEALPAFDSLFKASEAKAAGVATPSSQSFRSKVASWLPSWS
jgi:hypothetical protein